MGDEKSHNSRRTFLKRLGMIAAVPAAGAIYATQVEPFWPDFHELEMPIKSLPPGLAGLRITHLTDLHISDVPSARYVRGVIDRVNKLKPDLVVITGDIVSRSFGYLREACEILARLTPRTLVSFGNHDYGRMTYGGHGVEVSDYLHRGLAAAGLIVLRNNAYAIESAGGRLWIAGFEDLWNGDFKPQNVFSMIRPRQPVIALSHNPDSAPAIDNYGAAWTLCGHTHGGQIVVPGYGAVMLPVQNRQYQQGFFALNRGSLYVSRGIGYLKQLRLFCRPEIPTFTLRAV